MNEETNKIRASLRSENEELKTGINRLSKMREGVDKSLGEKQAKLARNLALLASIGGTNTQGGPSLPRKLPTPAPCRKTAGFFFQASPE